jgi:hypothetical protein
LAKNEKPYTHFQVSQYSFIRTFDEGVDEKLLEWHRDKKDRLVYVIHSGIGWKFQRDNELPVLLVSNHSVFRIKAEEYHRIIKGEGPLVLYIEEK